MRATRLRRARSRPSAEERGTAAVEMVLSAFVLVMIPIVALDFARAYHSRAGTLGAARRATWVQARLENDDRNIGLPATRLLAAQHMRGVRGDTVPKGSSTDLASAIRQSRSQILGLSSGCDVIEPLTNFSGLAIDWGVMDLKTTLIPPVKLRRVCNFLLGEVGLTGARVGVDLTKGHASIGQREDVPGLYRIFRDKQIYAEHYVALFADPDPGAKETGLPPYGWWDPRALIHRALPLISPPVD